ncbi:PREDICTED: uncharacterized protein LOC104592655 [Nelumbo nucifera]|uniref:Serine-rich protein-related n=2 Tax=Nelumbo nucifera TaxID=4432 RepID=A0A822ZG21_NELNU|nr:PREDICTED: uncharacterized protein LOC104592655 [Nelumbo nucifera]DAD45094.1 TPA_asm: hypothetical protein HUJ06_003324 [Nelumbo nucifera]
MASRTGPSNSKPQNPTRTCLCSPTNHPGSFRCSLHRNSRKLYTRSSVHVASNPGSRSEPKTMDKSNLLKEFLLQIIKPSKHDMSRRRNFQPKPTRFCMMNSNNNGVTVS